METISLMTNKLLASERTLIRAVNKGYEYLKNIALNGGDG
jgi:hypothetical protein